MALDMVGQRTEAEVIYDSLLKLCPNDVRLNYNAACCFAKDAKVTRSLDILEHLFPLNGGKRNEVLSDPDFDNIRSDARYQSIMHGQSN